MARKGLQQRIAEAIGLELVTPPVRPGDCAVHVVFQPGLKGSNIFDPMRDDSHACFTAKGLGFTKENGFTYELLSSDDGRLVWRITDTKRDIYCEDADLAWAISSMAESHLKSKR